MLDTRTRTLAKTFSWRIIATLITILIAWFWTRQVVVAMGVGSSEAIVKMVVYYYHERVWNKISLGYAPQESEYEVGQLSEVAN